MYCDREEQKQVQEKTVGLPSYKGIKLQEIQLTELALQFMMYV